MGSPGLIPGKEKAVFTAYNEGKIKFRGYQRLLGPESFVFLFASLIHVE
jgi:hypothetical protein